MKRTLLGMNVRFIANEITCYALNSQRCIIFTF
jgi:hypothetical protein